MAKRTVMSQLQSAGEEALGKLAQNAATRNALQGAINVKDRAEKVVRSLDGMEKRVAAIEKRLAALEKTPAKTPAKKTTPRPRAKAAAKPAAKPTPKS
jgi:chromosome segregation ATPase